jgi:hypothetical protein
MEMQMTLAQYIAERNAETLAWIAEDPSNRWAGLIVQDLAHWAEQGILTVRDFQRHDLICTIWDLYRDVTGMRPRHMDFDSMSFDELQAEVISLSYSAALEREREAEMEAMQMEYAYLDALEEDMERSERPEPIDYVAHNYQDGWL